MLVTKEQQERLVAQYVKDKHSTDECIGFIDGINSTLELYAQLQSENERLKAEREWISVEDLKEAFYEGQDGRYSEFDNWYSEYKKSQPPKQ